jgi:hypothetical protein
MATSFALVRSCAAVVLGASFFALPATVTAGGDCDAAKQALDQAQQALSKATRDADTRADAYAQCMQASGGCEAKKAAYDAALAAKSKAAASYKTASTRRTSACQ